MSDLLDGVAVDARGHFIDGRHRLMAALRVLEVSSASPDMSGEEFAAFKEDIRVRGQQLPIVLDPSGWVIDGRKRLRACQELGIEPKTVTIGADESPEDVARSLNLMRTHYGVGQLAVYAAKLAQRPTGQPSPEKSANLRTSPTAAQAAQAVGIGTRSVEEAKTILKKAQPEVVQALERGAITLHAAKKIAKMPTQQQEGLVRQSVAEGRGRNRRSVLPEKRERRRPVRPIADQMDEAVRTAVIAAEVIDRHAKDLRKHSRWPGWERDLRRLRVILSRAIGGRERHR